MYLTRSAHSKLHFGGHLEFKYSPKLGYLGTFIMFSGLFSVDPEKNQLVTNLFHPIVYEANVPRPLTQFPAPKDEK